MTPLPRRTEVQCRSIIGEFVTIICESINTEAGVVSLTVNKAAAADKALLGIAVALGRRELEQFRDAINDIIEKEPA